MLLLSLNMSAQKIYFVKYANQADLKIYFVKYENQSGWNNKKDTTDVLERLSGVTTISHCFCYLKMF